MSSSSLLLSIKLDADPTFRSQIEPTESEGLRDIDLFCDAMIKIRQEIDEIIEGKQPRDNNIITNAPHTQQVLLAEKWDRCVFFAFCAAADPGLLGGTYVYCVC